MTEVPRLRVDHCGGYDLVATDGTLDFDGGSLLVWRDHSRGHLVAAYGPATGWSARWEGGDIHEVPAEPPELEEPSPE